MIVTEEPQQKGRRQTMRDQMSESTDAPTRIVIDAYVATHLPTNIGLIHACEGEGDTRAINGRPAGLISLGMLGAPTIQQKVNLTLVATRRCLQPRLSSK